MTEELKILVKAEVAQAVSNLKEASRAADNIKKSARGITDGFKGLANFMMGPVGAVKAAVDVIGGLINAVDDLKKEYEEAELSQLRFSAAIETSENLYTGAEGRLSAYIDTLQRKSIADDDELKGQAALLAGYGRTEEQIKKILDVALDYSAATGKTLPESVAALSATMNGNTKELGRNYKEIKDLSQAQLENGDAIKILGDKYAGFSEKLRKSSAGTRAALEREIENLKEFAGKAAAALTNPAIEAGLKGQVTKLQIGIGQELLRGTSELSAPEQVQAAMNAMDAMQAEIDDISKSLEKIPANNPLYLALESQLKIYKEQIPQLREIYNEQKRISDAQENTAFFQEKQAEATKKISDGEAKTAEYKAKQQALADSLYKKFVDGVVAIDKQAIVAEKLGYGFDAVNEKLVLTQSLIDEGINGGLLLTDERLPWLIKKAQDFKDALPKEVDLTIGGGATVEQNQMPDKVVGNAAKYKQYLEDAQAAMDNLATTLGGSLQEFAKGLANEFLRSADSANALGQAFDSSSIEDYVVKAIDNLPMLLLTAGLQVVGYNPAVGIALIAASGLVALVDVFTTSEGERRAYGGSASTSAATASSTATASYSSRSASQSPGNVTVVQNIQGNVWTSRALEAMAQGA